jgi:hypothetical protein
MRASYAAKCLLSCSYKFDDTYEAHEAFLAVSRLNLAEQHAVASKLGVEPGVIKGLMMVSRGACDAFNTVVGEARHATREDLIALFEKNRYAEFRSKNWFLAQGAVEILFTVRGWDRGLRDIIGDFYSSGSGE